MPVLEVKNIQKRFGDTQVLKGITFALEKGQVDITVKCPSNVASLQSPTQTLKSPGS